MGVVVLVVAGSASSNRWKVTDLAVGAHTRIVGTLAVPADAQIAIIGVEVIEHARDLQPGGVDGRPPCF